MRANVPRRCGTGYRQAAFLWEGWRDRHRGLIKKGEECGGWKGVERLMRSVPSKDSGGSDNHMIRGAAALAAAGRLDPETRRNVEAYFESQATAAHPLGYKELLSAYLVEPETADFAAQGMAHAQEVLDARVLLWSLVSVGDSRYVWGGPMVPIGQRERPSGHQELQSRACLSRLLMPRDARLRLPPHAQSQWWWFGVRIVQRHGASASPEVRALGHQLRSGDPRRVERAAREAGQRLGAYLIRPALRIWGWEDGSRAAAFDRGSGAPTVPPTVAGAVRRVGNRWATEGLYLHPPKWTQARKGQRIGQITTRVESRQAPKGWRWRIVAHLDGWVPKPGDQPENRTGAIELVEPPAWEVRLG